jgi:hypothetical protein
MVAWLRRRRAPFKKLAELNSWPLLVSSAPQQMQAESDHCIPDAVNDFISKLYTFLIMAKEDGTVPTPLPRLSQVV